MASSADEGLPPLTPIKMAPPSTSAADAASAAPSQATSTTKMQVSAEYEDATKVAVKEDREDPSTPRSEESRLRAPEVCPPAPVPRMPSVKRKSRPIFTTTTARTYLFVPRDLSAVFRTMPPEKRIRAS
ncbi:uncharacterized protein [Lolium perenne]|uniref:uncharacterized protein n=1 Tax=Lolium perenne TaxID=4522 RepID=UPI0021F5A158|nr:uncharacterized protein LOC127302218 [Lolium perenne]